MSNNFKYILDKTLLSDFIDDESEFIPIINDEDPGELFITPDILPVLPLKNAVLFPGVIMPITVGREKSLQLVRDYNVKNKIIATATQKDVKIENPLFTDLYETATVAKIVKILEMPDGNSTVILQGKKRIQLQHQVQEEPYIIASVHDRMEIKPEIDQEFEAILSTLKDMSLKIIKLSSNIPNEAGFAIKNISNPAFLVNFISSNTDTEVEEKLLLLDADNLKERAILLMKFLARQVQMLEIKSDILNKARKNIDQQQRDYFLHQQMKTIQSELGGNSSEREIEDMKSKAQQKKWSEATATFFLKELDKLQRMNPQAGEHSVQMNYLQTLLDLPWNEYSDDNFDLRYAQEVLDADHYGLEKVKERIIEHLAVLKLKGDMKSPIICLYGPPGVGKTSLGRSIAKSLNRKYARMSLGGLHDEAEIRGHRKTYIGAMPGRIIQNIKKVGTSNPVFILDEIDKVGKDFRGDPESALLEVLDPEQNKEFHDNYLELDYDLSKVMFIATANNIANISSALRDRMEMIDVSGYIVEEKIQIAKKHLIPNQIENNGLSETMLSINDECLKYMIMNHTRESGVRGLDKKIAKVVRSLAKKIALDEVYDKHINLEMLRVILGPPEYHSDEYQGNEFAGVVTGLAWTAVGGDILFIETSLSKGKGILTMTGNLGNVMKESATIALEFIKAHAQQFDIPTDVFENWNVHVHVPEGAIPKDGPSAGITMVSSMVSAFTQRKVKKHLAMTGEITLRGKVLPVGGIKEKILAAKRAGIKEIILSKANQKDIEIIGDIYIEGLRFIYVDTIDEVISEAILKQKVKNTIKVY
ncbi:MAG: endopeptidase La [Bacteroidales bacterium]|nr:endopeptidase La [Bacteroidales bacterium]